MPFQRVWTCSYSGASNAVVTATRNQLAAVLEQLADVAEVVSLSQTLVLDTGNTKPPQPAMLFTTFLVYRVPSPDTAFDFEG